jgi:hypothetical protein
MLMIIGLWIALLFLVVTLVLAAAHGLHPNLGLLVARDIAFLVASVGLLIATVVRALDKSIHWALVALLVANLAWAVPLLVKEWSKRARVGYIKVHGRD